MSDILNDALDFASSLRKKDTSTLSDNNVAVDPFFYEDPKITSIIEYAMTERPTKNVLLVGPTGCGKSSLAINVTARLKRNLEIFSCDGETSTDNLIGKILAEHDKDGPATIAVEGAAIRAYREGKVLLLEEVDIASPEVLASLHRIMETHSDFYTSNIGREKIIKKHPEFMVIGTSNTIGTGEDTFMYSGTKALNMAFMNRFSITIKMDYLNSNQEIKVIQDKTGAAFSLAETLVNIANDVRDAADPARIGGSPGSTRIASVISTRDLLEWANLINRLSMDIKNAAYYTFLNRASDSDKDIIRTFIQNRT